MCGKGSQVNLYIELWQSILGLGVYWCVCVCVSAHVRVCACVCERVSVWV